MDDEPDFFDLQSWAVMNAPQVWDAVKYLSEVSSIRKILLMEWTRQGKPNIEADTSANH